MYDELSDELKAAYNIAVEKINEGLCSGVRMFAMSPETPFELVISIIDAFSVARWSCVFSKETGSLSLSENIPKAIDNKPADFKTGLRPVST